MGTVLLLALGACGGGEDVTEATDDKAACEALQNAEGDDEGIYEELRGMSLSSDLRSALDKLEASSASGELSAEVMNDASAVASLCRDEGVELQG